MNPFDWATVSKEFRTLLGSRIFWKLPADQRKLATECLGLSYLRSAQPADEIATEYTALIMEYMRREEFIFRNPIPA